MNKKTIILILIAIILIIVIVFSVVKNNSNSTDETEEIELNYSENTDDETGETTYTIYDETTGEVIAETSDESMIQMYLDNPDFTGPETEIDVEAAYEDETIVTDGVWGTEE